MDFQEKKLYHQIHPLKFATDVGATLIALYFTWRHRVVLAVLVGLTPPALVSAAMLRWPPDLTKLERSGLGQYLKRYMTPAIESIRFATLVPMAYGAWNHSPVWILIGVVILSVAWANGLIWRRPG